MTKLPSQSEIDVHWRAVPSLREIWAEERDRMARLLPPKDNFLSADNADLSFTLSVKKGAPTPGAKSAFDGNKNLFSTTPTLDNDFQRALNDIIGKYDVHYSMLQSKLDERKAKEKLKVAARFRKDEKKDQSLASILSQKDEALYALEGLVNQFAKDNDEIRSTSLFPSQDFEDAENGRSSYLSQLPTKNVRLSQLHTVIPSLTQADRQEVQESLNFCLEIDQLDSERLLSIDPSSLTPFDDLDDNILDEEENMQEEEFENSLNLLETQKFNMTQESLSQLDSVVNALPGSQTKLTYDDIALGQDSVSLTDHPDSLSPSFHEEFKTPPAQERKMSLMLSHDSTAVLIRGGDILELKSHPPNKKAFEKSSQLYLHSYHLNQITPVPWLRFSARTKGIDEKKYQYRFWQGVFVQPVAGPPSSTKIRRWLGRQRVKSREKDAKFNLTDKSMKDDMEFDSNSRKLRRVTNEGKSKRRVAFIDEAVLSSSKVGSVEEVVWTEGLSQTQESIDTPLSHLIQSEPKQLSQQNRSPKHPSVTPVSPLSKHSDSLNDDDPLQGIGQQGGKIYVEGGGLKAAVAIGNHSRKKLTMMSIEVHVQCRTGKAGMNNSAKIAMKPDPSRDPIFAVFYVYAVDPGNGEQIDIKERGCVLVPTENELTRAKNNSEDTKNPVDLISKIGKTMGISSQLRIEVVSCESQLLLRMSSIVQWKDPDALISWDTQNGGLGYLINRGLAQGKVENENTKKNAIDMVRLLGRTPKLKIEESNADDLSNIESNDKQLFGGSGLGSEWDDRVGAGAGPSSIVSWLRFFIALEYQISFIHSMFNLIFPSRSAGLY